MTQLHEPGTREAIFAEVGDRHEATLHVLRYFAWSHLPRDLQAVSAPCAELAVETVRLLADGPELTFALRQLLLAKDGFVRQRLEGTHADVPATGAGPRP